VLVFWSINGDDMILDEMLEFRMIASDD